MYKYALISDVHACPEGLEMVIADAERRDVDEYICCGDYVSDGPLSEEVIQRVRSLKGHVIRGNREEYMLAYADGQAMEWDNSLQFAPLLWTYNRLSPESIQYMRTLPGQKIINILGHRLLICHGSPYSSREMLQPLNTARFSEICRDYEQEVFIFGHTHSLWGLRFRDRYFINAGCSGTPDPTNPHFSHIAYGIMTVTSQAIGFERISLPYDFATFARHFDANGYVSDNGMWPQLILASLRTGHDYCAAFLTHCHNLAREAGISGHGSIPNVIWEKAIATWTFRAVL